MYYEMISALWPAIILQHIKYYNTINFIPDVYFMSHNVITDSFILDLKVYTP